MKEEKVRIVVLDDVAISRLAIKTFIEGIKGISSDIVLCDSFENTVEEIKKHRTSILIADIKLGNRSILKHLKEIKDISSGIIIITITGKREEAVSESEAIKNGADYFIRKPIWDSLKALLLSVLSKTTNLDPVIDETREQIEKGKNTLFFQLIDKMNVGISILDANKKPIYANLKQIEMSGPIKTKELCFKSFAPHSTQFCDGCPISANKTTSATHIRESGYFDINSFPLCDDTNSTIAYAKISHEVTDRERLITLIEQTQGTMSSEERIDSILSAIKSRGYSRVRMYLITEDQKYSIAYAQKGHKDRSFIGTAEAVEGDKYTEQTLKERLPQIHEADKYIDCWAGHIKDKNNVKEWGEIPLIKDEALLGIIAVDNYDKDFPDITFNRDSLKEIQRISKYLSEAIYSDLYIRKHDSLRFLHEYIARVAEQTTIEKMLEVISIGCMWMLQHYWKYIDLDDNFDLPITAHVMKKNGAWLHMAVGQGVLYEKGINELEIGADREAPCVKAVNLQKPLIESGIGKNGDWELLIDRYEKRGVDKEAIDYMKTLDSIGCFPVKAAGEICGVLSIQSPKPFLFNNFTVDWIKTFISKCHPILTYAHHLARKHQHLTDMERLAKVLNLLLEEREDENKLIWTMLTGLTHGNGLAYNRAIYFENLSTEEFAARYAVGPIDRLEADEIRNNLAENPISLEDAIAKANYESVKLNQYIENKKEVGTAFPEKATVLNWDSLTVNLSGTSEIIGLSLQYGNKCYGGLLIDNFYSGNKPTSKDLETLDVAGKAFALAIHNIRIRKYEYELFSMIFHRLRTDIAIPLDACSLAVKKNDFSYIQTSIIDHLWEANTNAADLLNYSKTRLESILTPNKMEININELVMDTSQYFSNNKILVRDIQVEVPADLNMIVDEGMIRHALVNLIDNAFKYSLEGASIIICVTKAEEASVLFSVKSSPKHSLGEGNLIDLFDRFKKGPASRGEGLGLYIVRKIAEAHGGRPFVKLLDNDVLFGFIIPSCNS